MTTYAFIGDPHVGNFSRFGGLRKLGMNERCKRTVKALSDALNGARAVNADYAVILGDLFDTMKPEPQLIDAVRQVFRAQRTMQIVLLKGNHDSASDEPRDTALYAVSEPNVMVIDQPCVLSQGGDLDPPLVLVPYRNGPVSSWLPGVLKTLKVLPDSILCLHAGIRDDETAPWLREAPDAIDIDVLGKIMDEHELALTFAGNWHEHKRWEDEGVHQVGALCPTGFSNLGTDLYGQVAIYRGDDVPVRYLYVSGPRFLKLGPEEDPHDYLPEEVGDALYIEWRVPADRLHAAQAEVEALVTKGALAGATVLPDTTGAGEGAKAAAEAARHGASLVEALDGFVGKMQLPAGVTAGAITARTRRYLGL